MNEYCSGTGKTSIQFNNIAFGGFPCFPTTGKENVPLETVGNQ